MGEATEAKEEEDEEQEDEEEATEAGWKRENGLLVKNRWARE